MAASIESRVPFLDDHVVEHVAALPGGVKLHGWQTKAVSARGGQGPDSAVDSHAGGRWDFPVPVGRWLRDGVPADRRTSSCSAGARRRASCSIPRRSGVSSTSTAPVGCRTATVSGSSSTSKSGSASSARANGPADIMQAVSSESRPCPLCESCGSKWAASGRRTPAAESAASRSSRSCPAATESRSSRRTDRVTTPRGWRASCLCAVRFDRFPYVVPKRGDRQFPMAVARVVVFRGSRRPLEVARAGRAPLRRHRDGAWRGGHLRRRFPVRGPQRAVRRADARRALRTQRRISDLEAAGRDRDGRR